MALGQLPPPGSKGLSSAHRENPSHSPPREQRSIGTPAPSPASRGLELGTSPPLPPAPEPPPPPAVRDPVLGTTSTAQQQSQTLPWPSGTPGKRVVPVLIPAWRHWLYWCTPTRGRCAEGFCCCVLTLPGTLFARQIQPFLTGGIPKAEHSVSFVSATPRALLELLRDTALEMWLQRSHCLRVRGWLWGRWDTPGAGRGWSRARAAAAGDASGPAQDHGGEL